MKKYVLEFIRRGLTACGFGPLVLAALYPILQQKGLLQMLTVTEVCLGILSLTALAFIAGGMNILYQIEKLPLMAAILIHGITLYLSYLGVYLINGWLEQGITAIIVFSAIFISGYFVIWAIIYSVTKKNAAKLNRILKQKQASENK